MSTALKCYARIWESSATGRALSVIDDPHNRPKLYRIRIGFGGSDANPLTVTESDLVTLRDQLDRAIKKHGMCK